MFGIDRREELMSSIRGGFLNYATYATQGLALRNDVSLFYATQDLALRTLRS